MKNRFNYVCLWILAIVLNTHAAPSRFEVMKTLKWRAIDALEKKLHSGTLSFEEKQITEYTVYKIKSSLGQFTNREYFEDLYHQTYHLVKIKSFIDDSEQENAIDNLIQFYQAVLREMMTEL